MTQKDKAHLTKIIAIYRERLQLLEEKEALYGLNCPPEVIIEIEDLKQKIAQFDSSLQIDIPTPIENSQSRYGANVTKKQVKEFRLFGIPIWSSTMVVTELLTIVIVVVISVSTLFGQRVSGVSSVINSGLNPNPDHTQSIIVTFTPSATFTPTLTHTPTVTSTTTLTPTP